METIDRELCKRVIRLDKLYLKADALFTQLLIDVKDKKRWQRYLRARRVYAKYVAWKT